jgi:hypothetical protein
MSERVAPQYCPYCGETDLWPHGESHFDNGSASAPQDGASDRTKVADNGSASAPQDGALDRPKAAPWECRSCTRVFTVKFVGMVV